MSTWAEQRRAERADARAQARLDDDAAAARARQDRAAAADLADRARQQRRADRDRRRAAGRAWRAAHAVDLFIYPLAVVAAAMAIPAMAAFGLHIFGATGLLLPVLSELGMWAFAGAVTTSRRQTPDRPTGWLTAGIGVFAAVGFGLNFAHGLSKSGIVTGLVMAVVSVAGVAAHQLVTATARLTRAERAAARLARAAARREHTARRIATRRAVVALAADGTATLLYTPGTYQPRRRRLVPTVVPGLPVTDGWDAALVDLDPTGGPAEPDLWADPITEPDQHESASESGGIAVADPPAPPPAGWAPRRPIDPKARQKTSPTDAAKAARRIAKRQGRPLTADQLRTALQIAPKLARELRDQINSELFGS
ncbi:hypothetical protein FF36_00162 [Frankia torreyi]|uniref:DUF2637 domain-containing protein n=1 Tax=Frankia torreyi TaxID=1856 RepID=A0A0D8BN48_9ACTN|nr:MULTISPECIES: hypothetical protein [Frankia]KJE25546.1 hypothetical protein FF36_00162 [Frankia torreyi]KQM06190.1 hypothetical protein FF86_101067 [Frankia sp. CpI1-P]